LALSIFVAKEIAEGEKRVAASPETVKKYKSRGYSVMVEKGAGLASAVPDEAYASAGAELVEGKDAGKADIILKLCRPSFDEAKAYKKGAYCICIADVYGDSAKNEIESLAALGLRLFAMELMPRISRAQSMDVLSSQANLSGYRAVIEAAQVYDRLMPMMMTAAGTVPPAKVFVMGAGVAGLSAIATARRLGAVVTATDVRPAAKEQVASLGAKFIAVEDEEFKAAETAGGYAKQMSAAYQQKQAELVKDHIAKQDIVITTALIPSRPAPKLVSAAMVQSMRPGSVLVDLAVERGGNIEGVIADKITEIGGAKIIGWKNMPSRVAATASELYARNLYAFISQFSDKSGGIFSPNRDDALVQATLTTDNGGVLPVISAFKKAEEEALAAFAKTEEKAEEKREAAVKAEGEQAKPAASHEAEPLIAAETNRDK